MVVGTPGFTAPERVRGEPATPASDLWSLGATLYAAVEGRGPFERPGGVAAIFAGVAREEPPRAPSAGPLAPVIDALLRRDPAARPDAAATAALLATRDRRPRPPARPPARRATGHQPPGRRPPPRLPARPRPDRHPHAARPAVRRSAAPGFLDPPAFDQLAMPCPPPPPGHPFPPCPRTPRPGLPAFLDPAAPTRRHRDQPTRPARLPRPGADPPPGTPRPHTRDRAARQSARKSCRARPPARTPAPARLLAPGRDGRQHRRHRDRRADRPEALRPHAHRRAGQRGRKRRHGRHRHRSSAAPGSARPARLGRPRSAAYGPPPPGYAWHTITAARLGTAAGLVIAVPAQWQAQVQGPAVYLEPPGGGAGIEVSLAPFTAAQPATEAREEQATAITAGQYPGYRRTAIEPDQVPRPARGRVALHLAVRRAVPDHRAQRPGDAAHLGRRPALRADRAPRRRCTSRPRGRCSTPP